MNYRRNTKTKSQPVRGVLAALLAAILMLTPAAALAADDTNVEETLPVAQDTGVEVEQPAAQDTGVEAELPVTEDAGTPDIASESADLTDTAAAAGLSDSTQLADEAASADDAAPADSSDNPAAPGKVIVTGFADFDINANCLTVPGTGRPSLQELTALMPASLEGCLADGQCVSVPVTWYCVGDDYETTGSYYVQFSPVLSAPYEAAEGLDILTEAPYIGVFLSDGEGEETLNMAAKAPVTSSPYEYRIFEYLMNNLGFSRAAAVGIMANIRAESAFMPNNLQDSGNRALNMTDDQYTKAVDNGSYRNFINDKYGYGLIQWTYYTRKQGLQNYAASLKTSISDYAMQLNFMNKELNAGYVALRSILKSAPDTAQGAYDCAYAWCLYFEQPSNTQARSVERGNLAKNTYWPAYVDAGISYSTTYSRIEGSDRYQTAIAAADKILALIGKTSFDAVVVACATNYPDALGGAPLAGKNGAPILLVHDKGTGTGTTSTLAYIKKRLVKGGKVYILGAEGAVPASVESTLKGYGFDVTRLGGNNRYETNLAIVNELEVPAGTDVYITTGRNFADALSVSGIAADSRAPIILTSGDLRQEALDKIAEIQPGTVYILGGTSAVPESVETQLKGYNVKRLKGNDRYETAVAIAGTYSGKSKEDALIATGSNFPDGLVAGPLVAELGVPFLLVSKTSAAKAAAYTKSKSITNYYIMGGEGAVPYSVVRGLMR